MSVTDAVKKSESENITPDETAVTEVWRVTVDNPLDNGFTVVTSPLLPQPYQPNGAFPNARVAQINPQQISGQYTHWDVTYSYSSNVKDGDDNPFTQAPEVSLGGEQFERATLFDITGKAIVNSANDPFDPAIMIDDSRPTFTVTENRPTYDVGAQRAYHDAVNSDVWTFTAPALNFGMIAPGYAKIKSFGGSGPHELNGVTYWKRTITIGFRREGWQEKPLDQGFHYIQDERVGHPTRQITAVESGLGSFTVAGDVTNAAVVGEMMEVVGSPDDDGDGIPDNDMPYTIASVTLSGDSTVIETNEMIASPDVGGVVLFNPETKTLPKPILVDGVEVKQPVLLDGHGYPMVVGYQSFQPTPADAVFLDYTVYKQMPFSFLGFV